MPRQIGRWYNIFKTLCLAHLISIGQFCGERLTPHENACCFSLCSTTPGESFQWTGIISQPVLITLLHEKASLYYNSNSTFTALNLCQKTDYKAHNTKPLLNNHKPDTSQGSIVQTFIIFQLNMYQYYQICIFKGLEIEVVYFPIATQILILLIHINTYYHNWMGAAEA